MKKLLFIVASIITIAGFTYYYLSAPKVLERRLDSLLGSLSFGVVTLKDLDKEAEDFASHFAEEVVFSGSGNEIISGTVSREEMQDLYLNKFRIAAKSSQAKRVGDFRVQLQAADRAKMEATLDLVVILRDNMSHPQTMPARLVWKKSKGSWVIAEVQLQDPIVGKLNE